MIIPYFILGAIASACLQSNIHIQPITTMIHKGLGPIVNASLLGALLPGCSCATMPLIEGLKSKLKNIGGVASFMMSSPLCSPQTIILTFGLLGFKFAIWRIIFTLIGSVIFGYLCQALQNKNILNLDTHFLETTDQKQPCKHTLKKKRSFINHFTQIVKQLGKYMIIGLLLSSLLTTLIPHETIPTTIGSAGLLSFILALLIGIPLYVHEGEEVIITVSLLTLGLSNGAAMTFLLGAVGTCIPTLFMARKVIGKVPSTLYITYWLPFAFLSGFLFQYF